MLTLHDLLRIIEKDNVIPSRFEPVTPSCPAV
jgi:hypothetical protein